MSLIWLLISFSISFNQTGKCSQHNCEKYSFHSMGGGGVKTGLFFNKIFRWILLKNLSRTVNLMCKCLEHKLISLRVSTSQENRIFTLCYGGIQFISLGLQVSLNKTENSCSSLLSTTLIVLYDSGIQLQPTWLNSTGDSNFVILL